MSTVIARELPHDIVLEAQQQTARANALPFDWSDWFPSCVFLFLKLQRSHLTVKDVYKYAMLRIIQDTDDPSRFIESAQCMAFLYYLDVNVPDDEDVIILRR